MLVYSDYKSTLMCLLLQGAVKQLLAVPSSVSICIRFSDPPHSVISSLHTVLQVPAHVVNLTVSPLPSMSTSSSSASLMAGNSDITNYLQPEDERDPYCRYRDTYQNPGRMAAGRHGNVSKGSSGFVRQKCDFAEMNRLLSQLAEVSLSLQQTKEECDMIAKRCPPKSSDGPQRKVSSVADEVDGLGARGVLCERAAVETSDKEVEKLIHLAQSITQGVMEQPPSCEVTGTVTA